MTRIEGENNPALYSATHVQKEGEVDKKAGKAEKKAFKEVDKALKYDPELTDLFDKVVRSASHLTPGERNVMFRLIKVLMELNEAFNGIAIAYADHLAKITEKLQGYSTLQVQVPVVTDGMGFYDSAAGVEPEKDKAKTARGEYNQRFGNALQAIQANRGLEEDKAKKLNAIMQAIKDAGQQASDFLSSFLELMQRIMTKFFQ